MILKRREVCLSLIEQANWISEESPETADRFIDAAAASFSFLEKNPEIGRVYEAKNGRLAGVRVWRISETSRRTPPRDMPGVTRFTLER